MTLEEECAAWREEALAGLVRTLGAVLPHLAVHRCFCGRLLEFYAYSGERELEWCRVHVNQDARTAIMNGAQSFTVRVDEDDSYDVRRFYFYEPMARETAQQADLARLSWWRHR